jgi:hypothetical protein
MIVPLRASVPSDLKRQHQISLWSIDRRNCEKKLGQIQKKSRVINKTIDFEQMGISPPALLFDTAPAREFPGKEF